MDKEEIERIAQEVAHAINVERGCATYVLESTATEFATRFLARIDAERARNARAWEHTNLANGSRWVDYYDHAQIGASIAPLFLSPTIQEGMALVPKVATEEMVAKGAHALSEWLDDAAPLHERRYLDPAKSAWADMLAAAQGERK